MRHAERLWNTSSMTSRLGITLLRAWNKPGLLARLGAHGQRNTKSEHLCGVAGVGIPAGTGCCCVVLATMLWHQRTLATERSPAIFSCANNSLIGVAIRQGGCPFLFPPVHRLTSIQPVLQCRAMRSSEMYFVLLVLAAVVGGISLDLLRILHRSLLTYFLYRCSRVGWRVCGADNGGPGRIRESPAFR